MHRKMKPVTALNKPALMFWFRLDAILKVRSISSEGPVLELVVTEVSESITEWPMAVPLSSKSNRSQLLTKVLQDHP